MKKMITMISGVVLALVLFTTGVFTDPKAYAADESSLYVDGARFICALHGVADNDSEIVLALYERSDGDLAYINIDGTHAYASFTNKIVNRKDMGYVERFTIADTLVLDFFMAYDIPCIMTEDGVIYVCEYLDAYVVREIMKLD